MLINLKLRLLTFLSNLGSRIIIILCLFLLNPVISLNAQTIKQPSSKNYQELVNRINLLEFEIERIKNDLPSKYLESLNNDRKNTINSQQNSNKEINKLFISKIELIEKNLQSLTAQIEKLQYTQLNHTKDINLLNDKALTSNNPKNQQLIESLASQANNTEVLKSPASATKPSAAEELANVNNQANDQELNLITDENQQKKEQYSDSVEKIKTGEYEAGAKELISFLDKYPNDSLEPNALYWLAESHYARRDFVNAAKYFWQGYKSDTSSNKAPDNLLKLGLSLQALSNLSASCDALNKFKKEFPNQPEQQIQIADKVLTSNNCK